jgi:hypothetical protein
LYALCQGFYLDIALLSVRSHLGRFRIVEDLMCVFAGDYETVDHLIWHCERFRLERHRFIACRAKIPIRDLCALKKCCAVKCYLDFLREFGIKL